MQRAELHFLAMRKLPVGKSVFPDVDFASVAEAFGFQAYTIRTLDELRRMLTRLIGEDISLVTELDDGAGCIMVDPGQLEQVILNLAVNARDAMPEGGTLTIQTRNVESSEHHDAHGVTLTVRDTGPGVPETAF